MLFGRYQEIDCFNKIGIIETLWKHNESVCGHVVWQGFFWEVFQNYFRRDVSMKLLKALLVVGLCLFSVSAWALTADDIAYLTEEYPPYNMTGTDGTPTGFAVDLLVNIFEKLGASVTAKDIQVVPWARGYNEAQNKPGTCLFSTTRTEERENLFAWVGPIYTSTFDAMALKKRDFQVNSPEDLMDLRAGVIRDDVGDSLAQSFGIKNIDRAPNNEPNIKKLNAGRIDIWIYGERAAKIQLTEAGVNPDDYESVWVLNESSLYYAFHKDTDPALLEAMQKVLDEMKEDGSYQELVGKYF